MVLTGLFLGCTRQIAVNPTTPGGVNTKTFTPVPPTNTFTVTLTPTVTPTPNGPTNTFTPTGTPTVTRTVTNTATPTLTVTATSTATPDPNMIDDFEDNDGNIIAQGGRNGFWYTANDASSTINPSTFLPTADTSDGSQYVGNVSGTVAASGFAELAASFSNPKVAYAIPGGATGVIFDVKATGPSSIWFSISDTYTDANGSDADG
ncbi:MAG TPA: hypothetical protein VFR02_08565, partial [bacterium]|nr:hypothetical protein [bacterium]